MNSEYLRTFVTLVQIGSYTKTAQKMIVVPSTISKQIKALEDELGHVLIIRDKKSVKLTRAGEVFWEYAKRILDLETACRYSMDAIIDSDTNVRIGTVTSLLQSYVTDWLDNYIEKEPSDSCSVICDHSQVLLNKLIDGEIDLCISYRQFNEKNCKCLPFVRDEMVLCTDRTHDSYPNGLSLEQLRTLPIIKESQLGVVAPAFYKELFDRSRNIVLSVSTGNMVVPFIKSGKGYAFVVRSFVQSELESGQLQIVHLKDAPDLHLQSYIVYKKSNPVVKKEMLEHLLAFAGNLSE